MSFPGIIARQETTTKSKGWRITMPSCLHFGTFTPLSAEIWAATYNDYECSAWLYFVDAQHTIVSGSDWLMMRPSFSIMDRFI